MPLQQIDVGSHASEMPSLTTTASPSLKASNLLDPAVFPQPTPQPPLGLVVEQIVHRAWPD
jgi:hypothetical protein